MALLTLTARERRVLEEIVTSAALTNEVRRAQALLWLDAGENPQTVAQRLHVSRQTVYNWIARFKERGDAPDLRARLADDQRSGRPETVPQRIVPLLRPVLDRNPHEFGYCSPRWTIALLARYLWGAHHVTASPRSVHLALERLREPQDSASLAP
jgi:transposase